MHLSEAVHRETVPVEPYPSPPVVVFVCANCARPGRAASSACRPRPAVPDFHWPFPVEQVVVPCAGRIQPEHLLKAFESGADLVLVVACESGNCHYAEGSLRCMRRVEFVRSLLGEIGLNDERLLLEYLPGSAAEDLASAEAGAASAEAGAASAEAGAASGEAGAASAEAGAASASAADASTDARIESIRQRVVRVRGILSGNPLRQEDPAGWGGDGRARV